MKKLAKILVLVLSVALLVGALVVVASAAGETSDIPVTADHVKWTEEEVIKVFNTEDAYLAAKESGNYEGANLSTNKLGAAFTHVKNKGEGYILLTADYNEGRSFIKDDNSALEYATVNLTNTKCTLDLNGKVLSMATNRWFNTSGAGNNVGYQRLQVSGSGVLTVIGNGGSLLTASNLVQFSAAGGTVNFEGGNGGLNIVACTGYSYDVRNGGSYNTNTTFAGSEGIVKNVKQGYAVATAPVLNILGDVTYVRENTAIAAFYCMYGTKGSIKFNIGKENADKSVRNTATFTTIDTVGSTKDSEVPRIVIHRDDAYLVSDKDVLTTNALLAEVNINNATVNCKDFKFSSLYNKNYGAATDDDLITYNINNSTLNFRGKDKAYIDIGGIVMKSTVPYRINVNSSEIYEGHNFINGSTEPAVSATTNTVRALTVIKDSYVSVRNESGAQSTFTQRIGSLVTENSFYDVGAFTNLGIYWLDYDGGAGKLADGTVPAWPTYAEEIGGYGVLIKDGNYFNSTGSKGNEGTAKKSPGQHTGGGFGSNKLGNLGKGTFYDVIKPAYGQTIWKIVSDAAIPNVTTDADVLTFNGVAGTTAKDFTAQYVTTLAGSNLCLGASNTTSRPGQFTVAVNPFAETENTYVTHKYWEGGDVKYTPAQPYFYYEVNTMSATAAAAYPLDKYAYYAIDFDLMTTEEFFTKNFNPQFFVRSYTAEGSIASAATIILSSDGTWKSYSGDSFKMDYTPGVWQHVTTVLEMPMTGGAVDYLRMYADAKIHLYVDGELLHTFTGVMPEVAKSFSDANNYKDGAKYAGVHEIRVSYLGETQKNLSDDAETSIDNVIFTRYAYTTTDTPATIGKYVYDNSAEFGVVQPEDIPFATYDDVVITAENAEEGLTEYYKAYLKGETTSLISLYASYSGDDFNPMEVAKSCGKLFKEFKYISNGYRISVTDAFSEVTEDNITTVTRKIVTVNWYAPDGTIYHTGTAYVGATVTVPKGYTTTNGWYKSVYSWIDSEGNAVTTSTVKPTGDISYYSALDKYVADMQHLSYNLRFMGHVGVELYIPAENHPDALKSITVYEIAADGTQKVKSGVKNIKAGDKLYTRYSGMYAGALDLGAVFNLGVAMSVELPDGSETILRSSFSIGALDYIEYVIDNSQSYKDFMPVVANMLQFSMTLYKQVKGQNVDIKKAEFYNAYNRTSAYRTPLSGEGSPKFSSDIANRANPSPLSEYATALRFVASNYESGFAFDFKEPIKDSAGNYVSGYVKNVTFVIEGYIEQATEVSINQNFNAGTVTHTMRQNLYYDTYSKDPLMVKKAQSGNISVHNITDDEITIILTVVNKDGAEEQIIGTYNLDAYYFAIAEKDPAFATFLTALKAYSDAASYYRYGGVQKFPDELEKEIVVRYSDFGAVGDGKTDDFDAIYRAHNYANALVDNGYVNVTVVAEAGKTYLIGDQGRRTANIRTNTDWTGASFIFYDVAVSNTSAARSVPIFNAVSEYSATTVTGNFEFLYKDATNIGYAPGYPALAIIYNENHRNYIRYGSNADNGFVQQDIVLVDAEGNIDPSTPLLFDTPVTSIELIRVDDSPITIKGGYFETVYNQGHSYINYSAYSRGILISRSNTTITGAVHEIDDSTYLRIENSYMGTSLVTAQNSDKTAYTEITKYGSGTSSYYEAVAITGLNGARKEENLIKEYTVYHYTSAGLYTSDDGRTITENGGTDYITYGYKNASGSAKSVEVNAYYKGAPMAYFIRVERANNVEVNKCVFENPKSFYYMGTGNNMVVMGSYENTAGYSNDVRWTECFQTNFRNDAGEVVSQGQMGSNYCKNMLYDGNVLSRLDAHKGAGNITVRNCEIGRVNIIGGGTVLIEDSIIYSDSYMINLRNDYGSIWMGDVIIDNVTVYNGSNTYLCIFNPTDFYNHDFGYKTVAPTNVYINDLTVIASASAASSLRMYFGYLHRYKDTTSDVVYKTDGTIYKNDKGGNENINPYTLVENLIVTGKIYAYKDVLSWKEVTHPTGYKTLHPVVQTFNANGTVAKSAPTYKLGFSALSCPSEYELNIDTSGATIYNQYPSGK